MEPKDIRQRLLNIYTETLEREIDAASFMQGGGGLLERYHINSLVALQMIVKIESAFNIVIEDDDVAIEILDDSNRAVEFIAGLAQPV